MLIETLRPIVSLWPWERGTTRISTVLGHLCRKAFPCGYTTSPRGHRLGGSFTPEDFPHPGFWFLYERRIGRLIRSLLHQGDVFVDVGANRGWHTMSGLRAVGPEGSTIACDPAPDRAEQLRDIARRNPSYKLLAYEGALGVSTGTAELLLSVDPAFQTVHTMVPAFNQVVNVPRRSVTVPVMRLDDLLEPTLRQMAGKPTRVLVKVDVEGAELDVLLGAPKLLRHPGLVGLIIEITCEPEPFVQRSAQCREILEQEGLQLHSIPARGKPRLLKGWPQRPQLDIVALRPGVAPRRGFDQ
jgi:FkbM family methyltransferase